MLGWIFFIITWVLCFRYTYGVWYRDFSNNGTRDYPNDTRLMGVFVACFWFFTAVVALMVDMQNRISKNPGFFAKFLKNLEKEK